MYITLSLIPKYYDTPYDYHPNTSNNPSNYATSKTWTELVRNISDNNNYHHYTFDFIQLNLQSKTDPTKKYTNWINAHSGTNTHQGLYAGLKMLEDAPDKTVTVNTVFGKQTVPRVPVLILISDGAPSLATSAAGDAGKGSGNNIWFAYGFAKDGVTYNPESANHEWLNDGVGEITEWWKPKNPAFRGTNDKNTGVVGYCGRNRQIFQLPRATERCLHHRRLRRYVL